MRNAITATLLVFFSTSGMADSVSDSVAARFPLASPVAKSLDDLETSIQTILDKFPATADAAPFQSISPHTYLSALLVSFRGSLGALKQHEELLAKSGQNSPQQASTYLAHEHLQAIGPALMAYKYTEGLAANGDPLARQLAAPIQDAIKSFLRVAVDRMKTLDPEIAKLWGQQAGQ